MDNKLTLSWTFIDQWRSGDRQGALDAYLHLDTFKNEGMIRGAKFDDYCNKHMAEHRELPRELDSWQLRHPWPQFRLTVPYNDRVSLTGIMDCYDDGDIHEIKCSVWKDSAGYLTGEQIPFYALLCKMNAERIGNPEFKGAKRAYCHRYDPSYRKCDHSMIWISDRRISNIEKIVDENVTEIYKFMSEEGLV